MRKKSLIVFLMMVFWPGVLLAAAAQPGRQDEGYGSEESYIAGEASEYILLDGCCLEERRYEAQDGGGLDRAWCFVPDVLKQDPETGKTQVVVFLHDFMFYDPVVYGGHIEHLWRQGYIVMFPQFYTERDQAANLNFGETLNTVLEACSKMLADPVVSPFASQDGLVVYGHGLGAPLALGWPAAGETPMSARAIVCANAVFSQVPNMNWLIQHLRPKHRPKPKYLNPNVLRDVTAPVTFLYGDDYEYSTLLERQTWYDELAKYGKSVCVRWHRAITDTHGGPAIQPDQWAPMQSDLWPRGWAMRAFEPGAVETDCLDYRYYYAGLDAAIENPVGPITFDMGQWSDGVDVSPVVEVAYSEQE